MYNYVYVNVFVCMYMFVCICVCIYVCNAYFDYIYTIRVEKLLMIICCIAMTIAHQTSRHKNYLHDFVSKIARPPMPFSSILPNIKILYPLIFLETGTFVFHP